MAHAEGWIEAYALLEEGEELPDPLKERVLSNRNGIGETMLHWYCIEGESAIIEKIIELGFDVNTTNEFNNTPLFECAKIGRWDTVEILFKYGADISIKNHSNESIVEYLFEGDFNKLKKLRELYERRFDCL